MFIKNNNSISDKDFLELIEPFNIALSEYVKKNILYEFVAFYIAKGFELNALYEDDLTSHVNSAIDHLSSIEFKNSFNYDALKKLLNEKYSLIITNELPLKIKEKDPI